MLKLIYEHVASCDEEEEGTGGSPRKFKVDLDYFLVEVGNRASTCITNNTNQFIGPLKTITNRLVEVYLGVIK